MNTNTIINKLFTFLLLLGFPSSLFSQFTISDSGQIPSIAYDLKGGLYVVWGNMEDAVHLKHLDSSGNTIENKTFVKTYASVTPRIAVNPNYNIVVWEDRVSNIVSIFNTYIVGNIFTNSSTDTSNNIMFNTNYGDATRHYPDAGFINDTTIVVVWHGNGPSTPGPQTGIYGQIVSTAGNKIGGNFLITDHIANGANNGSPRIIFHEGNNFFIVAWRDNSSDSYRIYGRKFNLNGSPQGSSFLISDDSAITYLYYYSVAKDTEGNFVVVWTSDKENLSQMEWRWFTKDGIPTTPVEYLTPLDTLLSSASSVDVSIDEYGRIVLVWEQKNTENIIKLFGKRFLADKTAFGNSFRITDENTSDSQIFPSVIMRNNKFFAVWSGNGIKGKILSFDSISSAINIHEQKNDLIETYKLYPCYPNPFNPSTIIQFQIPVNGFVTLKVFDLLGREVATVVNDFRSEGTYNTEFNGNNLSSGIYFYRLQSGEYIETRKMVLMK